MSFTIPALHSIMQLKFIVFYVTPYLAHLTLSTALTHVITHNPRISSNLIFYPRLTRRFYSNGRVALPVGDYAIPPHKALRMAYKGVLDLLTG